MNKVIINGKNLTFQNVYNVAFENYYVDIDIAALEKVKKSNKLIFHLADKGEPVYGLNRGVGWNKDKEVKSEYFARYNRNILNSHTLGIEPNCTEEEVRAVMLIRLNCALCGSSGLSVKIINMYKDFLNKGIHPVIPRRGSVGESDLGNLAHIGLVMIGEGEAIYKGERIKGCEALQKANLTPAILGPKEGLGIVSSNAFSAALAVLTVREVEDIVKTSNIIYSLGLEGLNGVVDPLDNRINEVRGYSGQIKCARDCSKYLEGSYLFEYDEERALQDPLSYRSSAAINGSILDALEFVKEQLIIQINSTDDNPCVLLEEEKIIGSANFEPISWVIGMEMVAIALNHLSKAACNRIIKLDDPSFTKLSRFLTPNEGNVIAYGTMQKSFMALDAENRMLANPSSIDFFPLAGNIEDHSTNAPLAVDKVKRIVDNLRYIIGMEAIHSAQAIDLRKNVKLGVGTKAAYDLIRSTIKFLDDDRNLSVDIKKAFYLLKSGDLIKKLDEVVKISF